MNRLCFIHWSLDLMRPMKTKTLRLELKKDEKARMNDKDSWRQEIERD